MSNKVKNPYVGPRSFTKEQRSLFFGREREVSDLLSWILSEQLVLFYAQSGAGKSSLINASLIPDLEKEGFEVLPVGRVSGRAQPGVRVDNIFVYELLLYLDQSEGDPSRFARMSLADFLDSLVKDGERYYYDDNYEYPDDYEIKPRVLIIDQFEEILTTHLGEWEKRANFFEQLREAIRDDPSLSVVLSMREDYVAALDPYAHLLPDRLQSRFHVQPMDEKAAMKAVTEPARKMGRPFRQSAARALVNNLRQTRTQEPSGSQSYVMGQFIEPVQLQVVCYQLWERREGPLGLKALEELADGEDLAQFADSALGQFYEQAIATVLRDPKIGVAESELRNWFGQELITEARTRSTVYQGDEKTGSLVNKAVPVLEEQFLIRAESRAGGRWYELVHDRFIEPVLKANQDWWQRQNPLFQAAREWERQGRERYQLYVGRQLEQALENVKGNASEPIVREFLEASKRADQARKEEDRVRKRFDRFVSLGALLGGAAIGGYVPIISLLFTSDLLSSVDIVGTIIGVLGSAVISGALGWLVIQSGYDWMRTRSATRNRLQSLREKLQRQN